MGGKTPPPFGLLLFLLWRLGLTRLVAANEMLSAGRSSLISILPALGILLANYMICKLSEALLSYILDLRASKASERIGTV